MKNIFSFFKNFVSIGDDGYSLNLLWYHFVMYASQIIMLYTLNLYNAICQLYLSKSGRKNNNN